MNGLKAENTYNHFYGNRVWDGDHCLADVDERGEVIRAYLWGPGVDNLLAVRVGGRNYAALTDIQGTVWGYADERGEIVARWTYDAWGNVLSEEIAESAEALRFVRYRFQGRERSAATGLIHFRARWYDPATGRWLSPDPIGLEGGLNLYCFCGNDPVNHTDPSGLCSDETPELPMIGGLGPSRYGPSGRAYRADAFGHGKNLRTGLPNDPHIHQQYGKAPDRIFNIDQTPRDRGPKVPKRDIGAFLKAVDDLIRRVGGRLTTFPVMFLPAIWLEPPDESGRLML